MENARVEDRKKEGHASTAGIVNPVNDDMAKEGFQIVRVR